MTIDVRRREPPSLGRCRSCQREIEWVTTWAGKQMPIDHPLIPVRVVNLLDGRVLTVIEAGASHFVTCPDAARFRRREGRY